MIFGTKDGFGGAVVMYDAKNKSLVQGVLKLQKVGLCSHQTFNASDLDDAEKAELAALFGGDLPETIMQSSIEGSGAVHLDRLAANGLVTVKA